MQAIGDIDMDHIVDIIVRSILSIIIGIYLIDLVSMMFLDFSPVCWMKDLLCKHKKDDKDE